MPDRDSQSHEIELAVVPDGFRHIELGPTVRVDPALPTTREGDCFVAEVHAFDETDSMARNHLHVDEQMVHVRPGDRIPLILAYRRSMMEFASATDAYRLAPGDTVWMLGGDGYAGSFECGLEEYGRPVSATVIGAMPGVLEGQALNVGDIVPAESTAPHVSSPVVVAVIGSRMDCGKSTAIQHLTEALRRQGLRIGAGKVTGFGCRYETTALHGDVSLDFTDYGLPSTCGPDGERVLRTAHRILDDLRRHPLDVVTLEFGGGLLADYRVEDVARSLASEIDVAAFVTFDPCGAELGVIRLQEIGITPALVTGPVANTSIGINLVKRHTGFAAESNRGPMPRFVAAVDAARRRAELSR